MGLINTIDEFEASLVGDEKAKGTVEIYCRIARWTIEYVGSVDRITRETVLKFRDLLKVGEIPVSNLTSKRREHNTMFLVIFYLSGFHPQ